MITKQSASGLQKSQFASYELCPKSYWQERFALFEISIAQHNTRIKWYTGTIDG